MDDTVVVAVNARRGVVLIAEGLLAGLGVDHRLLLVAAQDGLPAVTHIDAEGHVPVVAHLGRERAGVGTALPGVPDEDEADHEDADHDSGKQRAALEAHLLALATLSEFGDLAGR